MFFVLVYDYIADVHACRRAFLRPYERPAPLDISVTRTTCPVSASNPPFFPPSAAYDIESRFYDASPGAPSRRRSRCKLLFASLEEIRLRASKATCLPDGGRQRVFERASRDRRGGFTFLRGNKNMVTR